MHLLLGTVLLALQATPATIVGKVRDGETGRPLAGAVIVLTELGRAATSDADGRYELHQVPAGPHHITVRFIGYAPRSLHALVPRAGRLEISVSLLPDPFALPALEVRALALARGLDEGDGSAFPDRWTSVAAARNHPLLAEPDMLEALGGGEVVLQPESPSGVHIRGGASDQTAYLLDGIPVFSPYHAAGVFSAWNPDALSHLDLSSAAPSPAYPEALSGTVAAVTRAPATRHQAQGSVSTTQTRLTLDGPLGAGGAGYLVSWRSSFPGAIAPRHEASYLQGETGDWLAKLETPALGGRLRLLGYDSGNEVSAAAAATAASRRNVFEWHSQSLGTAWSRELGGGRFGVRVLAWSATGQASSEWNAPTAWLHLTTARRDEGLLAAVSHHAAHTTTAAGIRIERSTTAYRIDADSADGTLPSWGLRARTPVATAFAQHTRSVNDRMELRLGASVTARRQALYLGPRAQVRWQVADPLVVSGSYARLHQFAQSLRNAESVVGNVFPADLYLGAGAPGIPVARGDQGVIGLDYHPTAGVRFGAQAYARGSDGVLLVAPREGEPFTTAPGAFAVGTGAARGVSFRAAVTTARYGIVASYGLQRVRLGYADSSYLPAHGAAQRFEGGVIVFPTATSSIRLGVSGALGRRTTAVSSGLEWEACNLLDQGCEFAGSPHYGGERLGATVLPRYLRIDLGLRKHWHVAVAKRDAVIALFGSVTNLLGRKNVLTYATDPATGRPVAIEMRPFAPLVVGLDWQF
ncbi:MAG: carboxypeptidase regulatory-like domain-containing protein [Gemmatimonadales bacterium]